MTQGVPATHRSGSEAPITQARIAKQLNISGPVNIQFMARDNDVKA